jgi:hypothetical protein
VGKERRLAVQSLYINTQVTGADGKQYRLYSGGIGFVNGVFSGKIWVWEIGTPTSLLFTNKEATFAPDDFNFATANVEVWGAGGELSLNVQGSAVTFGVTNGNRVIVPITDVEVPVSDVRVRYQV